MVLWLLEQLHLPSQINFIPLLLQQHLGREINDDGDQACCRTGAAGDAADQLLGDPIRRDLGQARIEYGREQLQIRLRDGEGQLDELVFDDIIAGHDDEDKAPGVGHNDLEPFDCHRAAVGRHGVGGQVRQIGDNLADLGNHRVKLLHPQLHGLIHALGLIDGEAVVLHQLVDIEPVTSGRRNAPGGGMGLLQIAHGGQIRHLVADSRRGVG